MAKYLKILLVCKDKRVRSIRVKASTFFRNVKKGIYKKVSFRKKAKKWVWAKTEIEEKMEKIEKKIKRIPEEKEKFYKVNFKLRYERKDKAYKNLYIDGYIYVKAKDKEEAINIVKPILEEQFNDIVANLVMYYAEEVSEKDAEVFGRILHKHRRWEEWKQTILKSFI
jgi:hypothetical protein